MPKQQTKWMFALLCAVVIIGLPLYMGVLTDLPLTREVPGLARIHFLESRYLYLYHHLFSAGPVLIFGIVLNLYGYREVFFKEFLKPLSIVSLFFMVWDYFFNRWGVWGFNSEYVIGTYVMGLPVEELLWFYLIPFCSLFIYHLCELRIRLKAEWDRKLEIVCGILFLLFYAIHFDKAYSVVSCGASMVVLCIGRLWKVQGFGVFLVSFLINLVPMYIFNGMLTGLFTEGALVQYNAGEFSGIRWGSYPLEDIGFGFAFLYGTVLVRKSLKMRISRHYTV